MSREFFYIGKEGKPTDRDLFEEDPHADYFLSLRAIERAIQQGLPREDAEQLYGVPRPAGYQDRPK